MSTRERETIEFIRDAVLHGRYQLEGYEVDSDVINAVLGIIDDAVALLPSPDTRENGIT